MNSNENKLNVNLDNIKLLNENLLNLYSISSIITMFSRETDCTEKLLLLIKQNPNNFKVIDIFSAVNNYDISEIIKETESENRNNRVNFIKVIVRSLTSKSNSHKYFENIFIEQVINIRYRDIDYRIRYLVLYYIEYFLNQEKLFNKKSTINENMVYVKIIMNLLFDSAQMVRKKASKIYFKLITAHLNLFKPDIKKKLLASKNNMKLVLFLYEKNKLTMNDLLTYIKNNNQITELRLREKICKILFSNGLTDLDKIVSLIKKYPQIENILDGVYEFNDYLGVIQKNITVYNDIKFKFKYSKIDLIMFATLFDNIKYDVENIKLFIDQFKSINDSEIYIDQTEGTIIVLEKIEYSISSTILENYVQLLKHLQDKKFDVKIITRFINNLLYDDINKQFNESIIIKYFDINIHKYNADSCLYKILWLLKDKNISEIRKLIIEIKITQANEDLIVLFIKFLSEQWHKMNLKINDIFVDLDETNNFKGIIQFIFITLINHLKSLDIKEINLVQLINIGLFQDQIAKLFNSPLLKYINNVEIILKEILYNDIDIKLIKQVDCTIRSIKLKKNENKNIFIIIKNYLSTNSTTNNEKTQCIFSFLCIFIPILHVNECIILETLVTDNNVFKTALLKKITSTKS